MSRKRQNDITRIVRRAEAEGLSYGRYVAQEREVCIQRRPPILDTVKPRGISTIQAALRIDCPKLCANVKRQAQHKTVTSSSTIQVRKENPGIDEMPTHRKRNYTGCKGLPAEKRVRIRALRAQGLTLQQIAISCDVSSSSVKRYLKEDKADQRTR